MKSRTDRWIEIEMRIAAERNQWRSQKEVLENSREVLQRDQSSLQANLEANELATSLFRNRLEQAEAELAQHEAAHELLTARCDALETRLYDLLPRLPVPLRERIDPTLSKLESPEAGEPVAVSQRVQSLTAILSAIDLFNNSLTLTHHLRENGAGETIDIKALYWGLAVAYAVDARGENAWMLVPGADGWEWQDQTENVREIADLIAVYEKQESPRLVSLPAAITGGAQ